MEVGFDVSGKVIILLKNWCGLLETDDTSKNDWKVVFIFDLYVGICEPLCSVMVL